MYLKSLYIAPVLAGVCAFVACIGLEVFCFALCALFGYFACTDRIFGYETDSVGKIINGIIDFVSVGSRKDQKVRILAVNYALHEVQSDSSVKLCEFIQRTLNEDDTITNYEKLKSIKYSDIRPKTAFSVQKLKGRLAHHQTDQVLSS